MITRLTEAGEECGRKAYGLRRMIDAGFAVPDGMVVNDPMREGWELSLDAALDRLGPGPFAVRSSARAEDGVHTSYAGQLHTTLHVNRGEVAAAVWRSAESINAPRVHAYAEFMGRTPDVGTPVIVQRMLAPDISGVTFTRHPVTGASQVMIEAVRGLGDQLVGGDVTPDRWVIEDGKIIIGDPIGGIVAASQIRAIATLSRQVETLFGSAQDIEWAIEGGRVWMLQARPITSHDQQSDNRMAETCGPLLLRGAAASSGTATGPVKIISGLDDFQRFEEGDVLVCRTTSPAWTPLLARAAAVVTETGGLLAHAAIVAREFGIPAVLAAENAMAILTDHQVVLVDGTAGSVMSPDTERGPVDADAD